MNIICMELRFESEFIRMEELERVSKNQRLLLILDLVTKRKCSKTWVNNEANLSDLLHPWGLVVLAEMSRETLSNKICRFVNLAVFPHAKVVSRCCCRCSFWSFLIQGRNRFPWSSLIRRHRRAKEVRRLSNYRTSFGGFPRYWVSKDELPECIGCGAKPW